MAVTATRSARRPRPGLVAAALPAALLAAGPLAYLALRALEGGGEVWARLWATRIPGLLFHTSALVVSVTCLALLLAVPLAWLVARTDLPGRRLWTWVCALPLVVPPYLTAFAYISFLGPLGLVERWTIAVLQAPLPFSIYGFWGVSLVLALATYPYVYLLSLAGLRSMNATLEMAARTAGHSPAGVLLRVTLPLLLPSMTGGAFLVALYVLSDFGAVSLLRYPTFTRGIYLQLVGRYDRSGAAVLSCVLVLLTLGVMVAHALLLGRRRYTQVRGAWKQPSPVALGRWKPLAAGYVACVVGAAVVVPVATIGYWALRGWLEAAVHRGLLVHAFHSLWIAAAAATAATALAVPVAWLRARYEGAAARVLPAVAVVGYALPGVVVALSLLFLGARAAPVLQGTLALLLAAYVIQFLPQALQAQRSALAQVSPTMEEAAFSLGAGPARSLLRVTLPLIRPGLLAGWALAFVSTLKELPATLLLRPAGFDTLPVRVWVQAHEGFYAQAGLPALVLVLLSAPFLGWLLAQPRPVPGVAPPGRPC